MIKATARLLRDGAVSIAFPDDCQICSNPIEARSDGVACARCWEDPAVSELFRNRRLCGKCGARMDRIVPDQIGPRTAQPGRVRASPTDCGQREDLPVAAARACGAYTGAIEASIVFLKSHPHIHARLCNLVESVLVDNSTALSGDKIIPVPLRKLRLRERGFNQADVVARSGAHQRAQGSVSLRGEDQTNQASPDWHGR